MSPEEKALATVVDLLTRLAVPYMITGSVAASFHGRPRATHDADVVIDPTPPQLEQLLQGLADADFYVSPEGAREALRHRRPFNVIETRHACKIDLIIRRERPFSVEEFARRRPIDLPFGLGVTMVTPEDAVLSKLEWARQAGDSEKQLADVQSIVSLNPNLDRTYIERWAQVLGVIDLWRAVAAR